jgi:hypothetical protein
MMKKIITIAIISVFLLLAPSLSAEQTNDDPIIDIVYEGGRWIIKNIGDGPANNIIWSIKIDAPIIFMGGEKSGIIDVLQPGESVIVSAFVFGFGPVTITITISVDDLDPIEVTFKGFLFGPFLIGI